MNSERDKTKIINYPPERLQAFEVHFYQWIDNLNFTLHPKDCIANSEDYLEIAEKRFLEAGWDGDGEIELMWIPPFMFKGEMNTEDTLGVTVWHVKQLENGISWILSPVSLPFWESSTF